jgi:sialate O-acetylesterase
MFSIVGFFMAGFISIQADVKMPAIFGDHMVLQQDGKIPVWGTADPGESVKVVVGASQAQTQADKEGLWRVDLPALPMNATGQTMTVTGKNALTFQDVLIGEVWLASGQSNMELKMAQLKGSRNVLNIDEAIASAANPQIRLFLVARQTGIGPKNDVQGTWKICSPESVLDFSAVAFFFGKDLQESLKRPVGLIGSYWGGTAVQSWTSLEALKSVPMTAGGAAQVEKRRDEFPKDPAARAAAMADYKARLTEWQTNVDVPYQATIKKWNQDVAAAKASGQPPPERPKESSNHPNNPDGEAFEYTTLFNGMINPLIPYGMKGVIWYQGESNSGGNGENYDVLLKTMITDWRARWGEGDFTFLIVLLANMDSRYPMPTDSGWAGVRGGQVKVSGTVPNTGLGSAIDIGMAHNIHPPDKFDVGRRLAAAAKHIAYGQDIVYAGPSFVRMTIEGNKARITYKDIGSGLMIARPPFDAQDYPPLSTTELTGFAIAGEDRKWSWGKAAIDGKDIVVSSDDVPKPVAVRYGWAQNPEINLYNKEGFPAVPFRTDDWPFVAPPPPPTPTPTPTPVTK